MKRYKKYVALFLSIFLAFTCYMSGMAYERDEHDAVLKEVFFKNFKEIDNEPLKKESFDLLCSASYLAIDQFNGNGQKDLDLLIRHGVKGLPQIKDIDYSASGKTHRNKTHRGWNHSYSADTMEKWRLRQNILKQTADTVFDFRGDEKKKEAFCKLIYYTHILGDYLDNETLSQSNNNGLIINAGGTIDKINMVDEFIVVIQELFPEQKHTHKYISLTAELEKINRKFSKVVRSKGGVNTDEKFELHQEHVKKLHTILTHYLPEMLKEEPFFNEVYYR